MEELMKSVVFILVTASALCCRAQQSKTDPTMVKFFAGNWSCSNEFASGKKIEADVSFTPNSTATGFSTVTMTGHLGRSRL